MSDPIRQPRLCFRLFAVAVAVCVGEVMTDRADATCGDYLQHAGNAEQHQAKQPATSEPQPAPAPCTGPSCGKPPVQPASTAPTRTVVPPESSPCIVEGVVTTPRYKADRRFEDSSADCFAGYPCSIFRPPRIAR